MTDCRCVAQTDSPRRIQMNATARYIINKFFFEVAAAVDDRVTPDQLMKLCDDVRACGADVTVPMLRVILQRKRMYEKRVEKKAASKAASEAVDVVDAASKLPDSSPGERHHANIDWDLYKEFLRSREAAQLLSTTQPPASSSQDPTAIVMSGEQTPRT